MCCIKQGKYLDAIAIFKIVEKPSDQADEALYWTAYCYSKMDDLGKAAEIRNRFLDEYPRSPRVGDIISDMMESYLARGETDRALALADDYLAKRPGGKIADAMLLKKGDFLSILKKYDDAIAVYLSLPDKYPQSERIPNAGYMAGLAYLEKGDSTRAAEQLENVNARYPSNEYGSLAALKLGDMNMSAGLYDRAVHYYDQVSSSRNEDKIGLEALFKKGVALFKLGKAEAANAIYRDLINRRPTESAADDARLELAEEELNGGDIDEALGLAGSVIEHRKDEKAARANYLVGKCYSVSGKYEMAVEELAKVPEKYSKYEEWTARSLLLMAQCQINLGKKDEATETLRNILDSNPKDDISRQAQKLIDEIK
jgi:TolA-binding protein